MALEELRAGWREDLKRTNYFQYADSNPPPVSCKLRRRDTAREPLTMRHVIQKTADYAGLPSEAITGHTQRDSIVWWRRLATKLVFDLFKYTTRGRRAEALNRDPSSLDHCRKKAEWWYANDEEFKQAYHAILAEMS